MSPMARQSASKVRASALRRCALILAKSLLNWVHVRTVRRQEQKPGAALLQTLRGFLALVRRQVVEDHHVALGQGRSKLGLHIGLEDLPGHRPIDHPGRRQTPVAQPGDKGLGQPVAERRPGIQTLPFEDSGRAGVSSWWRCRSHRETPADAAPGACAAGASCANDRGLDARRSDPCSLARKVFFEAIALADEPVRDRSRRDLRAQGQPVRRRVAAW